MGSYNFTSPGAAGANAIQQFLVQRAMQQRQAMLDALAQQAQAEEQKKAAAELELRTGQERRMAEAQKAQIEDLANQREFGRASSIAENAMPGDPADDQTRALLERQGLGGQVRKVPGIVVPLLGSAASSDATLQPEGFEMRGGTKYLAQQEAERARKEQAAAAAEAAKERADAERAFRESDAAANRDLRRDLAGATNGVRNELAQLKLDEEKQKFEDSKAAKTKSETDARTVTQSALDQLQRMKTHPGLNKAQGAYEMRGFTQDAQNFNAIREQVVNALALPNLGALKGPMSDKDVAFVRNISTRLGNHNIDEAETVKAVDEAIAFLNSKLGAQGAASGGSGGFKVVGVR